MKNKELAEIFQRMADALELKGENRFRINAYRRAAAIMDELVEDVARLNREDRLKDLPGIGEGLARKIDEYLKTGRMKKYDETLKGIPASLLELLEIQNVGPKTLALANKELGVKNLRDLKKVVKDGSLAELPQMGEKKVENIRRAIDIYEQSQSRLSIFEATRISKEMAAYLKKSRHVLAVEPAGSLRRQKETIGDIDILVKSRDGAKVVKHFVKFPGSSRILAAGDTKGSIVVEGGQQVDIRIVPPGSFGAALQYFTGSKAHNIKLRDLAKARGFKLNEYGLFKVTAKGEKRIAGADEAGIYKALGLYYMPPEMREDRGEIELAQHQAPPRLIQAGDIKGDLQVHSNYSDGQASLEELARAGKARGYDYLLVSDHSRSAVYAHGMDEERFLRQLEEIDRINRSTPGFRLLKGVEVDIRTDGRLDFGDGLLKRTDLVVAAVHSGFKKNVTERMLDAIANPYVDILAHPTGRLISSREGYDVDIAKVMQGAGRHGAWLEIDAFYDRLDLSDVNVRQAKEMGVLIAIDTDAHDLEGLDWMEFGVAQARRGWLEKQDVVNTRSWSAIEGMRRRERRQ